METQSGPERPDGAAGEPERQSAPASMHGQPASGQLRFFQVLSAALVVLLLGVAAYAYYRNRRSEPMAVLVGGKPVATVVDFSAAQGLAAALARQQLGAAYGPSAQAQMVQPISFQHLPPSAAVDSESAALAKLADADQFTVMADAIVVGSKPVVALPDRDQAQAALDAVRAHYASLPPADAVIGKPEFRENVSIERQRTNASLCKGSSDEAAQLLLTAPPAKQYTIGLHETGWSIARKFHLSFTDFLRANPGRDLNNLHPGDVVNVSRSFPPLTVIVHKEHVYTEPILRGAPAADAGLRQITSIDTYVNGVRTGESAPVSVYTIRRAVPRSIYE